MRTGILIFCELTGFIASLPIVMFSGFDKWLYNNPGNHSYWICVLDSYYED